MGSRNGNIKKSLELGRLLSPQDVNTLRLGRNEVLLGLAAENERAMVQDALGTGWEERPAQTRLYDRLALRVVNEEDRQVLARAEGFRILLSEAMAEPSVDPHLAQLILDQAAKRATAEAALEAVRRQLTSGLVELSKLQRKAPKADQAVLRAQLSRLKEDVRQARDAVDREAGRLAGLLAIRANRRHAIALAESIQK